jgi:hypothetical protein
VYFIDSGFKNSALGDFRKLDSRKDIGSLAENYVFMSLKRKSNGFKKINFWRTKSKAEVDFVIEEENEVIPIEVKYSSSPSPGKSFYSFISKFSPPRGYILTKGYFAARKINNTEVYFIPVYYL